MDPVETIRLLDVLEGLGFTDEAFVSFIIFDWPVETRQSIAIGDTVRVMKPLRLTELTNWFSID